MLERFILEGKLTHQGETIVGGILAVVIIIIIVWAFRRANANRREEETETARQTYKQPAFPYGDEMTLDFRKEPESIMTEYVKTIGLLNRRINYLNQGIIEDKDNTEKKLNDILRTKEEMERFFKEFKEYYNDLLKTEEILRRKLNLYKK